MVAVDVALDAPYQIAGVVALSGFRHRGRRDDGTRKLQSKEARSRGAGAVSAACSSSTASRTASWSIMQGLHGALAATTRDARGRGHELQTNGARVTFLPRARA